MLRNVYDRYALLQPPPESYEIEPASIAQVRAARNGRWVEIDDDVGNVAKSLSEIDHHLRVRWSGLGEYFVVYYQHGDPCVDCTMSPCVPDKAELVLTAQELDQRVVKRVELIGSGQYDLVKEIERLDAERDKPMKFDDETRDKIERKVHAMRQIAGQASRIVVPG